MRSQSYIPVIIKAEYRGDYLIEVEFDNGLKKTIDFEPLLEGPVFEPLKDKNYFKSFFVDGGTVCWPNGADIAPETLMKVEDTYKQEI